MHVLYSLRHIENYKFSKTKHNSLFRARAGAKARLEKKCEKNIFVISQMVQLIFVGLKINNKYRITPSRNSKTTINIFFVF